MILKRIYEIKNDLYIYNVRNFIPYLMWNVIEIAKK